MYLKPSEFRLPYCKTTDEVVSLINLYTNEQYKAADIAYKEMLGSVETGHATETIVSLVTSVIKKG